VPPLHELAPGLPADLAAVIDRAVSPDPEHRPSASELADALAGAVTVVGGAAPTAGSGPGLPAVTTGAGPATAASGGTAVGTTTGAQPRRAQRWRPWLLGAAAALVLVAIAARGSSPVTAPGAPSPDRDDHEDRGEGDDRRDPRDVRVVAPTGMDGKQTRDWSKIVEALQRGHYDDARHKLREFEDKYGQTDETRALAPQLDQLGPDAPHGPGGPPGPGGPGPPGHGRGKKHRD
jgi:hypothetical protein